MSDVADYLESMGGQISSGGEFVLDCPFCGKTRKLYASSEPKETNSGKDLPAGRWICFSCDQKSMWLSRLMAALEGITESEARSIINKWKLNGIRFKKSVPKAQNKPVGDKWLPPEFESVADVWPKYLDTRGISRQLAAHMGLGVCRSGDFAHRIILPISCPAGKSFQARAIPKDMEPRYLSGDNSGQLLYGWDSIADKTCCVIVEGPFDALKVIQAGYPAVALMGKQLRDSQYEMLIQKRREYVVMLDPIDKDPDAVDFAIAIATRLDGTVAMSLTTDPGASTEADILDAIISSMSPIEARDQINMIRGEHQPKAKFSSILDG